MVNYTHNNISVKGSTDQLAGFIQLLNTNVRPKIERNEFPYHLSWYNEEWIEVSFDTDSFEWNGEYERTEDTKSLVSIISSLSKVFPNLKIQLTVNEEYLSFSYRFEFEDGRFKTFDNSDYILKQRLFFTADVCDDIDNLLKPLYDKYPDLQITQSYKPKDMREDWK